ncbi:MULTISPECIES: hypothetical protein [unclassified Micromonospora]|uniref:hypothetical protein n=1 Tax=unclassified Micromonospora TaxID=2617518 RepID=UPI00331CF6BB
MTKKPVPDNTPAPARDLILRPGDVVAVGLANKKCPVGVVTAADSNGFRLDLYSWPIGQFSAGVKVVLWSQVVEVGPLARQRADGVFEMDPLAGFQTAWTRVAMTMESDAAVERAGTGSPTCTACGDAPKPDHYCADCGRQG